MTCKQNRKKLYMCCSAVFFVDDFLNKIEFCFESFGCQWKRNEISCRKLAQRKQMRTRKWMANRFHCIAQRNRLIRWNADSNGIQWLVNLFRRPYFTSPLTSQLSLSFTTILHNWPLSRNYSQCNFAVKDICYCHLLNAPLNQQHEHFLFFYFIARMMALVRLRLLLLLSLTCRFDVCCVQTRRNNQEKKQSVTTKYARTWITIRIQVC